MFYGHVKNNSNSEMSVIPTNIPDNPWVIESNQEAEVVWYQDCLTVESNGNTYYYANWPIPENVIVRGIFSSSLNAIYNNSGLFFVTNNGELIPVLQKEQCVNT